MSTQRERNYGRYTALVSDIMSTLPFPESLHLIRDKYGPIASTSIARAEQEWALEKHRWMRGENAP